MQHLQRCQAAPKYHHSQIPEGLILLFRSGLFYLTKEVLNLKICTNHRNSLGTHWYKSSRRCCHPLHPPELKQKPDRGITCSMAKELFLHERIVVQVGSGELLSKEL